VNVDDRRRGIPSPRLLLGLAAAAAIVFAITRWADPPAPPLAPPARLLPASVAGQDQPAALAMIDRQLASDLKDAQQTPDWLTLSRLAGDHSARFRLSGDYRDLAAAQAIIDRAMALAELRTGPHLAAAAIALQGHRLAAAEPMLDAIGHYAMLPDDVTLSEVQALRGDIALYRGDYRVALRDYLAADGTGGGAGTASRRALLLARTGDPAGALAALDKADRAGPFTTPQAAANLTLQRGVVQLQSGDWPAAEASFAKANRIFPKHWLIEQHLAQMLAVRGGIAGAVKLYEAAIARSRNPETMDGLAALWRAQGDYAKASYWAGQAAPLWAERLRLAPQAAFAHAFEHELVFGNPKRAGALAVRDWRNRPHGGSAVALAWALLANGRPADALQVLDAVNAGFWRSAEQHAAAAEAHALLGQSEAAAAEREKALALNPRIFDRRAAMIWYGH